MLSKAEISKISSLKQKKYRYEQGLFVVEGEKIVSELLKQKLFQIKSLYYTERCNASLQKTLTRSNAVLISSKEMERISQLSTSSPCLAVVQLMEFELPEKFGSGNFLALDSIRDPGNLGTIFRIADWFNFQGIFMTFDSVDVWNPKCLQASMGSFLRVPFYVVSLSDLSNFGFNLYAASMQGNNLFEESFGKSNLVIIGNESHGLSEDANSLQAKTIHIPRLGKAESLNAAVATAIICAEMSRNQ